MRPGDLLAATALAIATIGIAALIGGTVAAVIGVILAAVVVGLAVVLRPRPLVAIAIAASAFVGMLIGQSIVNVLCLPDECTGLENFGGILTSIGAAVGVTIVVALVTRSFDEYREAVATGSPPPEPGCETASDEDAL